MSVSKDLIDSLKPIKSIVVVGRRWFSRTYGNTYHSASVYVDGLFVLDTGVHYGYGDQYRYTAKDCLTNGNVIPQFKDGETFHAYTARTGILWAFDVSDVAREKDLK